VSVLMLGSIGGTLAILGVIILPITSGDTSFRSARMIIADYIKVGQVKMSSRLWIAIPLFVISVVLTRMDFNLLWRYFSWANQSTAMIALWVGAMYLGLQKKPHWVATIPAIFMTMVTFTYILNAPIGFGLSMGTAYMGASIVTIVAILAFIYTLRKRLNDGSVIKVDEDVPQSAA
jgi:carbon starvation protein CstA